jgi:hypothetical protein
LKDKGDRFISRHDGDFVESGGHSVVGQQIGKLVFDALNVVGVCYNVAAALEAAVDLGHNPSNGGVRATGAILGHPVGCLVVAVEHSLGEACELVVGLLCGCDSGGIVDDGCSIFEPIDVDVIRVAFVQGGNDFINNWFS